MRFSWTFLLLLYINAGLLWFFPVFPTILGVPLLLLFWLADLIITRRAQTPSVERQVSHVYYQGEVGRINLVFSNPCRFPLRLRFQDGTPWEVKVDRGANRGVLKIPPRGRRNFSYEFIPEKRGRFPFGAVHIRASGPLRLFLRTQRLEPGGELRIYPGLARIDSILSSKVRNETEGAHYNRVFSLSGEFTELREYVPGDEYKKVNWKVSAHLGKPVVNEFEPEKDQNVFALIDSGRVLYDQREEAGSRLDFIVDSVLLLANSILTRRDQAGLMAFNWKVQRYVPPGKGPGQMSRIMAALFDLRAEMVESDYAAAFNYWTNRNHKRSLLFFYTDFTDRESAKEILGYLRFISRRHLVVCVVLRRDSLATYLEKPLKKEADAYLKGVALELLRERQGIIKELRESGVYVLEAETKAVGRCVAGHYLYLKRRGLF